MTAVVLNIAAAAALRIRLAEVDIHLAVVVACRTGLAGEDIRPAEEDTLLAEADIRRHRSPVGRCNLAVVDRPLRIAVDRHTEDRGLTVVEDDCRPSFHPGCHTTDRPRRGAA